jgi:hypothetical protein
MRTSLSLLICIIPTFLAAQVPTTMAFQGSLADSTGAPQTGTFSMDFSLHTLTVGGSEVWNETQPTVEVNSGLFNVMLGAVTPLDSSDFAVQLFLEIAVSGEVVGDRVALSTAPYAFRVANLCNPGDYLNCYTASMSTMGVGECVSGTRSCAPGGSSFGTCEGEVTPVAEVCDNGLDENCDGVPDDGCCVEDDPEPNNSELQFVNLGTVDADEAQASASGTLVDTTDVDWYRFFGEDTPINEPEPQITITASQSVEVCAYFKCNPAASLFSFSCSGGSSSATSPQGLPGCCLVGNGTISTTSALNCDQGALNLNDDVLVFISVDDQGTAACLDYTLDYGI